MGLQKAGLCYAEIMNNGIFTTIEYSFLDEPFLCLYEIFLSIKDLEISAHSVYCKSFIYVHKNLFAPQTSDLLKKMVLNFLYNFVVTCSLGLRLWCLTVSLSLSHWYPGSGVAVDCIDS